MDPGVVASSSTVEAAGASASEIPIEKSVGTVGCSPACEAEGN